MKLKDKLETKTQNKIKTTKKKKGIAFKPLVSKSLLAVVAVISTKLKI